MQRLVDIRRREICTLGDFVESYKREMLGKRAAEVLERNGVFPLTYSNPQLSILNVLGLHVFYSGKLHYARKTNCFKACINGNRQHQRNLADLMKEHLELDLKPTRGALQFNGNGASYARLLHLMGFPATSGSKHVHESTTVAKLPPYLRFLIDNYEELTPKSQKPARKLLRDWIFSLVDTRGSASRCSLVLFPKSHRNKEKAKERARNVYRVLKILYPDVEFEERIGTPQDGGRYTSRMSIPLTTLVELDPHAGGGGSRHFPVAITVSPKSPVYSFETPMVQAMMAGKL